MHSVEIGEGKVVAAALVKHVKNMGEVIKGVRGGSLDACFLKAKAVPDLFLVAVAARSAQAASDTNSLKTKTINTELLYALYPNRQVRAPAKAQEQQVRGSANQNNRKEKRKGKKRKGEKKKGKKRRKEKKRGRSKYVH